MERIAWALIRYRLRSELAIELRICIETLWALPAPGTPFASVVLPSSVLVGLDGTVELGVPYPADQRDSRRYLAPELAREPATVASAIYAVGALLFEAVSGSPFESSEAALREVGYLAARAQATGLRPDASDLRLLEIAARATHQNPEERWATPELFSRELDSAAGQRIAARAALAEAVRGWVRQPSSPRNDTSDHRSAALVTTLVVALPLIGMTLWNWRTSAHAADRGEPQWQQHIRASVQAPTSVVPVPEAPTKTQVTRGKNGAHEGPPRIEPTKAPAGEPPARAPRRAPQKLPTFKPRGPFDYGI